MTAVCRAEALRKEFGGVTAVRDVSLAFRPGVLHGLIGPNGAGKSTLVNLISGQLPADGGAVFLDGEEVSALACHQRARAGIGRTFQATRLPMSMTAAETVFAGGLTARAPTSIGYMVRSRKAIAHHREARADALRILALLDLERWRDEPVARMPFAEQRRLEIARALALGPKVVMLDEPTAGMHVDSLPAISRILRRLCDEGLAVVIIEHNVPFIRDTVDELAAMDAGALIANGTPAEVLARPDVIESYLGKDYESSAL